MVSETGLAGREIEKNLFRATSDGVDADLAVNAFDAFALSTADATRASEDLGGFSGAEFERLCGLDLGESHQTSDERIGNALAHLIRDRLHQGVGRLDVAHHLGNLGSNHLLFDSLVSVFGARLID